ALTASPHDETASCRRERYPGALTRKGHSDRGPVEQDGRLFKPSDAAINAKGHDEKNNGTLELRMVMAGRHRRATRRHTPSLHTRRDCAARGDRRIEGR